MLEKIKYSIQLRIILAIILVFFLVLVRVFQDELFYDPFIHFFKTDYHFNTLPEYDLTKLLSYLVLRYTINYVLSIGIIYTLFQKIQFIRLASILYLGAFLILIVLFLILLLNLDSNWYYLFFNIRRFLIHPVLLILFTAAFYSYNKNHIPNLYFLLVFAQFLQIF